MNVNHFNTKKRATSNKLFVAAIFLSLALLSSCTSYFEYYTPETHHFDELTPFNITTDLPVINIIMDQNDYDYMYEQYNEDIEFPCRITIYRNKLATVENIPAELSIKGGVSRHFELKSLGIKFQQKQSNHYRQILNPQYSREIHNLDVLEAMRLRNSGNDFGNSMIKDISYTQLALDAGLDVDVMYGEQAMVFLNNSFLGLMNKRSESTARGIAGLYGVNPDQVHLCKFVKGDQQTEIEISNGDARKFQRLFEAIDNRNIAYIKAHVDINNFIDYMIFQSYTANWDWPHNNVRIFVIGESKFRFFVFDLDQSNTFNLRRSIHFFMEGHAKNPVSDLFYLLYQEQDFRESFYGRYTELLLSEKLSAEKFQSITKFYLENIQREIIYNIQKYNAPRHHIQWYMNIDIMNIEFQQRENFIRKELL